MLVLTRKPGQSIMIGDGVEVQVLSVAGEKVRLGITAPRDVSIFRNEVYERIENESAGGGAAAAAGGGEGPWRPPSIRARRRGMASGSIPPSRTTRLTPSTGRGIGRCG